MARYKIRPDVESFAGSNCFVCQVPLSAVQGPDKRTLEHLIPQWMIREFGLEKATVTVGPMGQLHYKDFLLPCCSQCNSRLLGPVERSIKRALTSSKPERIVRWRLAAWACKIILGMQLYERFSRDDRSPESGGEHSSRAYLAALRGQVQIRHLSEIDYPYSLYWIKTKVRADKNRNFDFHVGAYGQTLYLRLGSYSLLARPDFGYLVRHGHHIFERFIDKELAPLQVEELAAHFFAMAECSYGDHVSTSHSSSPGEPTIIRRADLGRLAPFSEETIDRFVYWFPLLTGANEEELILSPQVRKTFLLDAEDQFLEVDAEVGFH